MRIVSFTLCLMAATLTPACGDSPTAPTAPTVTLEERANLANLALVPATRIIALSGDIAFGEVLVGDTATSTFTISNTGNSPLTWRDIGTGILDVSASPTSGTVATNESQTVTVTFSPVVAIAFSGTLTVTSDKTSGTNTIAYTGTATATGPTTTPTPTPEATRIIGLSGNLAFGEVTVGDTATNTLTISNTGNSTLTWSGISTGTSVVTANQTTGTVAAGGAQTVTLTFSPVAFTVYNSTLTVTSDKTGGTHTIALSGTGVDVPYNCCPPANRISVVHSVAAEIGYPGSGVNVETLTQKVAERLHAEDPRWGRRMNNNGAGPLGKDTVAYKSSAAFIRFYEASDGRPYSIDIVLGSQSNNPQIHWNPHGFVGGIWVAP